jgi:hypothetical protein
MSSVSYADMKVESTQFGTFKNSIHKDDACKSCRFIIIIIIIIIRPILEL